MKSYVRHPVSLLSDSPPKIHGGQATSPRAACEDHKAAELEADVAKGGPRGQQLARAAAHVDEVAVRWRDVQARRLGFGRIVASEIEVPIILVDMV